MRRMVFYSWLETIFIVMLLVGIYFGWLNIVVPFLKETVYEYLVFDK